MRSLLKPNLRVQDGPTEYLLGQWTKLIDFKADSDFKNSGITINYNSNVNYSWKETFYNSSDIWNNYNNVYYYSCEI